MNVLILNTVALNGGDGAILTALMDGLRERLGPAARYVVHEAQPAVAARYYPDLDFRPTAWASLGHFENSRAGEVRRRIATHTMLLAARGGITGKIARKLLPASARRALDEYRSADVVITTGGTYLVEHYDLSSRLFSFDVAMAAHKPLIFYTQSLGPFSNTQARRRIARLLSRAELVLLRDALSLEHVTDLGGRTDHAHVVPDCVFSLADKARLVAATTARRAVDRPLQVAVSVRDWSHFRTKDPSEGMRGYLDAVRAATIHLVEQHGAHVTFLSTCQGIPEYAHDDARTAERVVAELPSGVRTSVSVDGTFHDPRQLLQELSRFDLIVATRMHFAILGLVAGVPVLPIAYEFKMRELFGHLGQGRWVHDIEHINPEDLISDLDALLTDEVSVRRTLFAAVADACGRANEANDMVGIVVNRLARHSSNHSLATPERTRPESMNAFGS